MRVNRKNRCRGAGGPWRKMGYSEKRWGAITCMCSKHVAWRAEKFVKSESAREVSMHRTRPMRPHIAEKYAARVLRKLRESVETIMSASRHCTWKVSL